MFSEHEFSELIGVAYDAALDRKTWPHALERLNAVFGGSSAHIAAQDVAMKTGAVVSAGIDPEWDRRYAEHYVSCNVLWQRSLLKPAGVVFTDRMIMPKDEFCRSEFYNDYLRPQDGEENLILMALRESDSSTVITIFRAERYGAWDSEHLEAMKALMPHLRRALQVNLDFVTPQLLQQGAAETLDHLAHGVIIVDGKGRPLFVNRTAREIVAADDGLALNAAGLRAELPAETSAIRRVIAAATGALDGNAQGGAVRASRRSLSPPFLLVAVPMRSTPSWLLHPRPSAVVFVSDPDRVVSTLEARLRQLYSLTRTEAAVAVRILRGVGLRAVADDLGITLPTARTHLQRVFAKTRTGRQAELVRLICGTLGIIA